MTIYRKDDVQLTYEVHGSGFPILLIAPGGLRSERGMWSHSPMDPVALFSGQYQVISMDQRNAGESTGPIEEDHDWATYTQDQLDLMTHLGHQRFAVVGMCIGGPYILNLLQAAPDRVVASVVMQTIGRDNNREEFLNMFDGWAGYLHQSDAAKFPQAGLDAMRGRMFENDLTFMCMSEAEVQTLKAPMLILDGADLYHPASSSQRLAELQPQAQRIHEWKESPALDEASAQVSAFLAEYSF